jgi:hypothetical protein
MMSLIEELAKAMFISLDQLLKPIIHAVELFGQH